MGSPEFLRPNELQLLPKLNNLALGSMVLINFSINPRTLRISSAGCPISDDDDFCELYSLLFHGKLLGSWEERKDEREEG